MNLGMEQEFFMKEAIRLAVENVNEGKGGPFGAVVVKNGQVIAASANRVTCDNDPTAHAEVSAIRQACQSLNTFNLEGCEIYCSCQPCPMCLGAIYWAHIDKIFYAATKDDATAAGFDDSFIYKQLEFKQEQRAIPEILLGKEYKNEPFEEWIRNESKIPY